MRADEVDGAGTPAATGAWYRPMLARATEEEYRSATVLELFPILRQRRTQLAGSL